MNKLKKGFKKLNKNNPSPDGGADDSAVGGGRSPGKRSRDDFIARVLCLLAAFLIWLYVMNVDSPQYETTFHSVLVTLENAAQLESMYNLSVISGFGNVADLIVRGKRSEIGRYSPSEITAYADLSEITEPGKYTLSVYGRCPGGLLVSGISPGNVEVYVDTKTTKAVEVRTEVYYDMMDASYTLGIPEPETAEINISGPGEVLDKIEYALVELNLGTVTETVTSRSTFKLIGFDGEEVVNPYVRPDRREVLMRIPVTTHKEVPLSVDYKHGLLNARNSAITINPATVIIKGDPKQLAGIDKVVILTIDEKKLTGNHAQNVPIVLPEGTTSNDAPETAEIQIKHIGTEVAALVIDDFTVNNPGKKTYEILDEYINVSFRGDSSILAALSDKYVSAKIDLSHVVSTGTIMLPVTISLHTIFADSVYELGDYMVQVRILN